MGLVFILYHGNFLINNSLSITVLCYNITKIRKWLLIGKYMQNFKKFQVERNKNIPFFIGDFKWDYEGLSISLVSIDGYEKLHFLFDKTVYSYQVTQESYKPTCWIDSVADYYPFYYTYDSDMIDKLKEDVDYLRDDKIIHFLIVGQEDVVDVLTSDMPIISKK